MNTPANFLPGYRIRACYSDTDAAGVIHHARLLELFERSRTEWLESIGAGPMTLSSINLLLVIREITLRFHRPGRLNDILIFTHRITKLGNSQFVLDQGIYRNNGDDPLPGDEDCLASASFHIVCVSADNMKSQPIPAMIITASNANHRKSQ